MQALLAVLDATFLAVGFIGLVGVLGALVFTALVVLAIVCAVSVIVRDGASIWAAIVRLVKSL